MKKSKVDDLPVKKKSNEGRFSALKKSKVTKEMAFFWCVFFA
jgi:hypothetical protein